MNSIRGFAFGRGLIRSSTLHVGLAATLMVSAAALASAPAAAQPAAEFFTGNTIRVIIAAGPGGGLGAATLLIAPFLEKYTAGNPKFIPQYMGGAGGSRAANYIYNVAPRDGSHIGILLSGTAMASRLQATAAKYDPKHFQYLGGAEITRSTIYVLASTGVRTLEDAKKTEVIMGSTGRSSETYISPMIANALFGTKFKVVTGYEGISAVLLAIDRGEVHGSSHSWSGQKELRPQWIRDNSIVQLAIVALDKEPDLPNVPLLTDFARNDGDLRMLRFVSGNGTLARAWMAPPGVPADRVDALREGFTRALADPNLATAYKERNLELTPVPWKILQDVAKEISDTPDETVNRVKKIIGAN